MSLYRTYLQASIVETLIEIKSDGYEGVIYSYPWLNGREKGFVFSVICEPTISPIAVFVAEHRSSDNLTITVGKYNDWGLITDEEYNAREFFPYGSYEEVANRVLEILGVEG